MESYQKEIKTGLSNLKDWFDWEKYREPLRKFIQEVIMQRKVLLILGALSFSFWVISLLIANRRRKKLLASGASIVVNEQKTSFISELIRTAVRTFILYYARKLLLDFLNQENKRSARP
ncbi:MAG: hypothetical protein NZ108_02630 [Bacteroidia bacterium]|nr:hypothetical protein [Bacteroidia bacterium]